MFLFLNEIGIIKTGYTIKETVVEKTTTNDSNATNNKDTVKNESKYRLYSGELSIDDMDFGKVEFNGKEVNIKYIFDDTNLLSKIYVDDKVIEISNQGISNIAIMGDYLVIGYEKMSNYKFEIYNSNLEKVEEVGNSFGAILGNKADTSKWIIDENNLIYYQCTPDYSSRDNDKLETYNLKINGTKIEKVLLSTNTGLICSSQR